MTDRKAIFITGGASGIGQAAAALFAAKGWRVGIADVNLAGLRETLASLPGAGHSLHELDVRDRAGWVAALDAFTAAGGGKLDCLFNNAGIPAGGPFAEIAFADLDRVIAINLVGVLNGARIGHSYLAKAAPGSCLLNTASASAIYGSSGLAAYSVTKFGVRALTEALDGEWAEAGIKVRAIVPGFIDTPLLKQSPHGSNRAIRDLVQEAGLELTSADTVAETAWAAVHGDKLHNYVGKTAFRLAFAARWLPGRLRKQMRRGLGLKDEVAG
ncbi:MAG: SDR family oxidoreductase [Pseudomonadota bacterium]